MTVPVFVEPPTPIAPVDPPEHVSGAAESDPLIAAQNDAARWKALSRQNEQRAKDNADAAKKLADYEAANQTASEKVAAELEKAKAAHSAMVKRAVSAEIKSYAANMFADPEDAAAFLDSSKYATSDGDINTSAVQEDLKELLTRKPHLAKQTGPKTPAPDPSQGAKPDGTAPTLDERIAEAENKGDWKTARELKLSTHFGT